eukprot:TRINITY_DN3871_c0_g1_i1.p1 TRINITY_DN3871_c0_g1~~TRINITY_DN3871_c0_g1_i1.p1  ORF type:complete len:244 (-),score=37.94 TRINITY_DN3871_c0_g1_i1:25-756(-)
MVDGEEIKGSPFFLSVEQGHPEDETSLNAGFPRLIRLSAVGRSAISTLMPLTVDSLNPDDVFLLDNELVVYQWNGPNTQRVLKISAGHIIKVLNYDRRSALQHRIIEGDSIDIDYESFWLLLGTSAAHAPQKISQLTGDSKDPGFIPKCLVVNEDESIEVLAEGTSIKTDILNPDKVIILDTGFEVFLWEGRNCSNILRKYIYQAGKDYVKKYNRPEGIIVKHILEGSENWTFKHFLNQENIM